MRIHLAAAIAVAATACTEPSPQPLPNEMERVANATRVDPGVVPGGFGNQSVNYGEGNITPGEREPIREVENQSAAQLVDQYANLIVRRQFDDAYRMWDPAAADFTAEQLAKKFERFETMQAAVGDVLPPEGAAGPIQNDVQLTLSGTTRAGSNYTLTGPVTVRRVDDAPGRLRIVKMVLTADPRAAELLVDR